MQQIVSTLSVYEAVAHFTSHAQSVAHSVVLLSHSLAQRVCTESAAQCGHNLSKHNLLHVVHSPAWRVWTQSVATHTICCMVRTKSVAQCGHNVLHSVEIICWMVRTQSVGHNVLHIICCTLHILRLGEYGHHLLQHTQSVAHSCVLLWLSVHVCKKTVYCMTTLLHDNFEAALRDNLTTLLENDFSA